jgi:hypothetical protein
MRNPRGFAVLPVMLLMVLSVAVALAAAAVVRVEILIAEQHARASEALAAAEGGVEMAMADLRPAADWTPFVGGLVQSPASQGAFAGVRQTAGGALSLCCAPGSAMARVESDTASSPLPARRAFRWRPYLWTPVAAIAPRVPPSRLFLVVWIANDEADVAGGEAADTNGTVTLRAEAIEPGGPRRIVEALVGRHPPAGGLYGGSAAPEPDRRQRVAILRWREVR